MDRPRMSSDSTRSSLVARWRGWLARDLWLPDLRDLPWWKALGYKSLRVAWLTLKGFNQDNCLFRASALTYVTVLSLMPLLAVSFSLAKGFGFYSAFRAGAIDPFLDESFGPRITVTAESGQAADQADEEQTPGPVESDLTDAATVVESEGESDEEVKPIGVEDLEEVGEVLADAAAEVAESPSVGAQELRSTVDGILDFVEGTDFTGLSVFGLGLLVYAVIRLLGTVEKSLNLIWGVQKARSFVRKIADYLTIVVITPLFVFTAIGVTTAVQSSSLIQRVDEMLGLAEADVGLASLIQFVLRFAPLIAIWIGFTFVYMVMPNTRTKLVSALLGGVLAGTLWQLAQLGFIKGMIGVGEYNALYVGFATFPIFMIWIYISWVTVLLGAELAAAHQGEPAYRQVALSRPTDHSFKEIISLRVMARIAQQFLEGGKPLTASEIADHLRIPARSAIDVVSALVRHELLAQTDESGEPGLLPARSLEQITVKGVLDALKGTAGKVEVPSDSGQDRRLDALLDSMNEELERSSSNLTFLELGREAAREDRGANETRLAAEAQPG